MEGLKKIIKTNTVRVPQPYSVRNKFVELYC